MSTKHPMPPEAPQTTRTPEPPSSSSPNASGTRARLRAYLAEKRRARMLALGLGLLAVVLAVWWLVAETGEPTGRHPVLQAGEPAGEEAGTHADECEDAELAPLTAD